MYIVKAVTAFLLASAGIDDSPVNFDATPMIMADVPTGLVKIFNRAANGSLFTFGEATPQNVFIQHNTNDYPGGSFVWDVQHKDGDFYTFTNQQTKESIVIDNNYLITKKGDPAQFEVTSAGPGEWNIKLSPSSYWRPVFDHPSTCPGVGRVNDEGSTSDHWEIKSVNSKK
ncbi:hypothetical protein MVEN_01693200 [Mycena venus]|uniref:Uncharacterized protein n=1 Tax=Mycena venus TaxID=2733690 RepID=A0A8H7CQ16_9AGAR|nr:hypothetical protein MVEN_01693200 [Mycena venus]